MHDYVGISGATPDPLSRTNVCTGDVLNNSASNCNNGLLVPFVTKGIKDCTDGTSTTIIVAEQSGVVNGTQRSNNPLGPWHGWANSNNGVPTVDGYTWTATSPLPLTVANKGSFYPAGTTTVRYQLNAYWNSSPPSQTGNQGFSANTVLNSAHSGVVLATFADGSVRPLKDVLDIAVLRQICVRDDGVAVGDAVSP